LLLNNDTVLARDALRLLEDALAATPDAGVAGPRVVDLASSAVISAGERHSLPLLCVPRTLLRYRRRTDRPYRVRGVMGCALLVTRACFEAVGGLAEEIEVYYEDVDFCLGAAAHGFAAVVEPRAVVGHDGMRGFAAGLTPWAAYLKARNPWLVGRRRRAGRSRPRGRRGASGAHRDRCARRHRGRARDLRARARSRARAARRT